MIKKPDLLKLLTDYGNSDFYPFHMPGHKRQWREPFCVNFPNPFLIDITEIHGFDSLHHPEGILKESMDWASKIYGSDRTYYLVNGSSCGILSAISGTVSMAGTILMARNCHKSAFHGVFLNRLKTEYIYPQMIEEFGLQGGIVPEKIKTLLINHPEVEAVLLVSPTYDGIVSDIKEIANTVHKFNVPLIVDEAHGAHFSFGRNEGFPVSAIELGADVVIQSLHKTLPSFTQTAVMHVKKGYVNMERLDRYVHIYQTSSPSYIMLASIDNCIEYMAGRGKIEMKYFSDRIRGLRESLKGLSHLKLFTVQASGRYGVYDQDLSKIIISTRGTGITGEILSQILRNEYHLEMEMSGPDYVTAILTMADTEEGLNRLSRALIKIDSQLGKKIELCQITDCRSQLGLHENLEIRPESRMTIAQTMDLPKRKVRLKEGEGEISAEFVYVYPPGIPIIVPGEILKKETIDMILAYREMNLSVQGLEDMMVEYIYVVDTVC